MRAPDLWGNATACLHTIDTVEADRCWNQAFSAGRASTTLAGQICVTVCVPDADRGLGFFVTHSPEDIAIVEIVMPFTSRPSAQVLSVNLDRVR
jgi:hypothetical protein